MEIVHLCKSLSTAAVCIHPSLEPRIPTGLLTFMAITLLPALIGAEGDQWTLTANVDYLHVNIILLHSD